MNEIYTVCGASGNTGGQIAKRLLEKGKHVRVVGRSRERLRNLLDKGAEACIGDLKDTAFLRKAFDGVTSAFLLIPTDFESEDTMKDYDEIINSMAQAVENSSLKNVVALSCVGAHLPEKTGFVVGLHNFEERLKNINNINLLILRSGYFMENTQSQLRIIEEHGKLESAFLPDVKFPIVATRDVAEVVAKRMLAQDFVGYEIQEALGPRDLSFIDIANILSKSMNRNNLQYQHLTYENEKEMFVNMGFSESVAQSFVEMEESCNSGEALAGIQRNPENTTKTSYEEFANDMIKASKKMVVNSYMK